MLKIPFSITEINYILKQKTLVLMFHNIIVFTAFFIKINAALVSIRHFFQKHKNNLTNPNISIDDMVYMKSRNVLFRFMQMLVNICEEMSVLHYGMFCL